MLATNFPLRARRFDTRAVTKAWTRCAEPEIIHGVSLPVDRTETERDTFGNFLKRFAEEVPSHQKGGAGQGSRIRKIRTDALTHQFAASTVSRNSW